MAPCTGGTFQYTVREGDSLWLLAQRFNVSVEDIRHHNPEIHDSILYIGQDICIPGQAPIHSPPMLSPLWLSNHLRLLWEQHVYWTRLFIVSTVFNLPDATAVTNRLLQNPKDFEAVFRPIYGEAQAAKFEKLLTAHLMLGGQFVKASALGNSLAAAQYEKQWYENADDIASFLSQLNPFWPEQEWRRMLQAHLAMTTQQAAEYIKGDYKGSVPTFDRIEKEALEMADRMTMGIKQQFPDHFSQ